MHVHMESVGDDYSLLQNQTIIRVFAQVLQPHLKCPVGQTEPCLLASEMKLGLQQKEPGFLRSIHRSRGDNFSRACIWIAMQRQSLAPWLLGQSRSLYQRTSSLSYPAPQTLEGLPLPLCMSFFPPCISTGSAGLCR